MDNILLSSLVWTPMLAAVVVLLLGERPVMKWVALAASALIFLLSLMLLSGGVPSADLQFVEHSTWIDAVGVRIDYYLGVDGISIPLIILNTFITIYVIGSGWELRNQQHLFFAAFLIMEGIVNGVFAAQDAMLFYIFFEAMLIPMFLVIGIWGGPRRVYATLKFFLYTFLGSVFLLISLIYLYQQAGGSFLLSELYTHRVSLDAQVLIFFAFLLAFGVKVPMWPVHTWLPDAHVEAPTAGSVILAAITLKVGGYAFLRFALPILPLAIEQYYWVPVVMSLTAIVYVGFVALVQEDMKKLVAYSSIAHMGFVTLAFFMAQEIYNAQSQEAGVLIALQGGMVQMISHGFISAAMFLCIGVLYDRLHTREIRSYGGVANRMPWFAALFVLFAMANSGLPGTSGFVGEFMVLMAAMQFDFFVALVAALTMVIGAAYSLWLVKRVIFGEVRKTEVDLLEDINLREALMLGSLAFAVLWLGIWPDPLTSLMEPSLMNIVEMLRIAVENKDSASGQTGAFLDAFSQQGG